MNVMYGSFLLKEIECGHKYCKSKCVLYYDFVIHIQMTFKKKKNVKMKIIYNNQRYLYEIGYHEVTYGLEQARMVVFDINTYKERMFLEI